MQTTKTKWGVDQSINFVYHTYSSVYEDLGLKDIDREVLAFVPRCLWDVNCKHYELCCHALLWKQLAASIIQHMLRYRDIFLVQDSDLLHMDVLDLAVWFGLHSNIIDVVTSMYCPLNIDELSRSVQNNHTEMFELFCKYIKKVNIGG